MRNKDKYLEEFMVKSAELRKKGYCEICGALNHEPHHATGSKVILTVHHLDLDRENNNDDNLVQLCQSCHLGIHRWLNTRAVDAFADSARKSTAVLVDDTLLFYNYDEDEKTFSYQLSEDDCEVEQPVRYGNIFPCNGGGYSFKDGTAVRFLFDKPITNVMEHPLTRKILYKSAKDVFHSLVNKELEEGLIVTQFSGLVFFENGKFVAVDTRTKDLFTEEFDSIANALRFVYTEYVPCFDDAFDAFLKGEGDIK